MKKLLSVAPFVAASFIGFGHHPFSSTKNPCYPVPVDVCRGFKAPTLIIGSPTWLVATSTGQRFRFSTEQGALDEVKILLETERFVTVSVQEMKSA